MPDQAPRAGVLLYQHGQSDWDRCKPAKAIEAARAQPATATLVDIKIKPSLHLRRGLERRSPSSLEGGQRIHLAHEMRLEAGDAMKRGGLIHAWFELIEWLDDGPPTDEALERAARPQLTSGLDVRSEMKSFRTMLNNPQLQTILSRGSYADPKQHGFSESVLRALSGPVELRNSANEHLPFAMANALLGGSIDRLVTLWCNGKLVAAEIVDFKTDQINGAGQIADRIEFYRPQLEAYRGASARMLRLPAERILCRIAFVEPGIVRVV